MAKRIVGIVLVLAIIGVIVMAILESRSRFSPAIDGSINRPIIALPDSIDELPLAVDPDSL